MHAGAGTTIGPFRIERELGRGGMGVVFLAHDTRLDRRVAIKALPDHLIDDPDRLARFQREARTLASLNHPNIASIYGLESHEKLQYLVLEYVEGETLAEVLTRGPLPVEESLTIAKQIAEALDAAHEKGVIHRDVKPGNVIITPEGSAKVLDFGLARAGEGSPSSTGVGINSDSPTLTTPQHPIHSPTIPGAIMGTAGYMSPEQARGKAVDKRSDIFSFGCVLYEMLTGVRPFTGETVADALGATLHKDPPLELMPATTPPRVRELATNCLEKDRRNRLHDIGDARIQLERALAGREWTMTAPVARPRASTARIAIGLVGAAALVALGAGLWSMLVPRDRPTDDPVCVAVTMPPGVDVQGVGITRDAGTLVVRGKPKNPTTSGDAQSRIYTRRLDTYEFEPIKGTEGALYLDLTTDSRRVRFTAPVASISTELRCSIVPLDGSAPPTSFAEWNSTWSNTLELGSGEILVADGDWSFVRVSPDGGTVSPPVKMDVDRTGVQRVDLVGAVLPGDRSALVTVISYGSRGFQFSIGVMDLRTGHVRVIVEDGGCPTYSPTGHLVFSRSDVVLAAPFDPVKAELRGAPVAVWSGLSSFNRAFPAIYTLTDDGTLFYPVRESGRPESIATLGADGAVHPWSSESVILNSSPSISPDGRTVIFQMLNARGIDQLFISPVDRSDLVLLGTEPNADSFWAAWSPEGKRIAYARVAKDDRDGLYVRDLETNSARRIARLSKEMDALMPNGWVPDGTGVVCTRGSGSRNELVVIPVGDGEVDSDAARPFLPSESNRLLAKLSPDHTLVAFIGEDSGTGQVWVAEMRPDGQAGRPTQVKTALVNWFAWARDGKSLFIEDGSRRLLKVDVTPGPPLSISTPAEIADLRALCIAVGRWAPLADGRFLVGLEGDGQGDIVRCDMVLHWDAMLKHRVPAPK